jgi:hypothetical protein
MITSAAAGSGTPDFFLFFRSRRILNKLRIVDCFSVTEAIRYVRRPLGEEFVLVVGGSGRCSFSISLSPHWECLAC